MSEPRSISAITLTVTDMDRSCAFYAALGFRLRFGGPGTPFTSYGVGQGYLNLQRVSSAPAGAWGRAIIYVDDVDGTYERATDAGLAPLFAPRDAAWGERYFHIVDPDGHELSFARPLKD